MDLERNDARVRLSIKESTPSVPLRSVIHLDRPLDLHQCKASPINGVNDSSPARGIMTIAHSVGCSYIHFSSEGLELRLTMLWSENEVCIASV